MPRFVGCLVVLLAALFPAGCAKLLDDLTFRPIASVPADHVVVFGRVDHEKGTGLFHQFFGAGGPDTFGRLRLKSVSRTGSGKAAEDWVTIGLVTASDFFAVIPKSDYEFDEFIMGKYIRCPISGFTVPPDASAVYVGRLEFRERYGSFYLEAVTLSVVDEYEQAVRRLRERNPEFTGNIVKGLFGRNSSAGGGTSCWWEPLPTGGIIPII